MTDVGPSALGPNPPPPGPAAPERSSDAAIYERGYRRYDGARTGVPGAIRTLVTHSIRAILGLGRSARHKIMPLAVIGFAFTPAVVFIGLAALLPSDIEENFLPTYAEYYGFISAALFLFSAFVAPELLCSDRRTGMLGVYLASPLNRRTYLLGKTIAITSILAIVTIGPPLLLLIALSLEDAGPASWSEGLGLGIRIIAAGGVMSAFYAAISMAVSATTDRKGAATATTLGLLIGSAAVTNGLVEGGDLSTKVYLGNLLAMPLELAFRIHGETGDWTARQVSTSLMALAAAGIIAACSAWVWDRYRRMLVRR